MYLWTATFCVSGLNLLGDEDETAIGRGLGDIRVGEETCLGQISNSAVLSRKPNGLMA
jgi:hypothetical protein